MTLPVTNPINDLFPSQVLPSFPPNGTTLLVVDMQYFDAHPDWGEGRTAKEVGVAHCFDPYFEQIDAVIPHIQDLLHLFRRKEMEVIHVRVAEWTDDSRDVGRKQLVRGLIVPANSREADLLEAVGPEGDELVVSKSSSGVFPVTNIDRLLRNLGMETLIFTGTATGGCIESAVRDAVDLNYNVVVVSDACADATPASHRDALGRMMGGPVHSMRKRDLIERIQAQPDGSRQARSGVERVQAYLPKRPETPPGPDVNPYSLIFPPAVTLPLTRQNTALILIDAQRFICDPEMGIGQLARAQDKLDALTEFYDRVNAALQQMGILLAAARKLGIPVLHVGTASHFADGRDLTKKLQSQTIVPAVGETGGAFMPQVSPSADEMVIVKRATGIYTTTGLDDLLRNLGIEHLIMAAISYDGALEGSLRSASDRGYGVVLVPDACATFHPALQQRLPEMESGIISTRATAQVVEILGEMAASTQSESTQPESTQPGSTQPGSTQPEGDA